MSWTISVVGKPEKIAEFLDQESERQTGQSKIEFDDAKPHLQALLRQTFAESVDLLPFVKLAANGSGSTIDGKQIRRSCTVSIESFYTKLV